MKTLNIGILGTGGIATAYAKPLVQMQGLRVSALCNRTLAKAQAFNDKHLAGAATCYDDFDQMLAQESLDALFVCMPPGAHSGQAEKAARKGIHLMLEKPIALTLERAESIRSAVREGNVVCQIGHHFRHTEPVRKLKQMLTDGSAGRPLMMQARFYLNGLFPAWWRDPQMGGGQLIEQSIHLYDLARHVFGDAIAVAGFAGKLAHDRFDDYRVDDASASVVRFKNGGIASISACNLWEPQSGSVTFDVMCEKVLARFKSPTEAEFIYHDGRKSEEVRRDNITVARETVRSEGQYGELARNFIAAVRGTESTRSTIDDGVEGLRLVLAVAHSSATGGAVQRL
jgi:predicted dehydrogenase